MESANDDANHPWVDAVEKGLVIFGAL